MSINLRLSYQDQDAETDFLRAQEPGGVLEEDALGLYHLLPVFTQFEKEPAFHLQAFILYESCKDISGKLLFI